MCRSYDGVCHPMMVDGQGNVMDNAAIMQRVCDSLGMIVLASIYASVSTVFFTEHFLMILEGVVGESGCRSVNQKRK